MGVGWWGGGGGGGGYLYIGCIQDQPTATLTGFRVGGVECVCSGCINDHSYTHWFWGGRKVCVLGLYARPAHSYTGFGVGGKCVYLGCMQDQLTATLVLEWGESVCTWAVCKTSSQLHWFWSGGKVCVLGLYARPAHSYRYTHWFWGRLSISRTTPFSCSWAAL